MAQTSWPFENIDTTEVQFSQWARHINEGIRPDFANELEPFADDSGLNVKVKSGQAMVRGHYYASTAEETLTITTPDATNPRIDSVVLELDIVANSILLKVVAGTPAGSPVAPTLTQSEDGNVYQFLLGNVAVAAGVFSITAGDVTDLRTYMFEGVGKWTTDTRPENPTDFQTIGYNTTLNYHEYWDGSAWQSLANLDPSPDDIITTQGDLIIGDVSGNAVRLPVGSADQVLTSDGTTVSFQDAAGGGSTAWTLISTADFPTGSSTATISGLSGYDKYFVIINFMDAASPSQGGIRVNGITSGYANATQQISSSTFISRVFPSDDRMGRILLRSGTTANLSLYIESASSGGSAFFSGSSVDESGTLFYYFQGIAPLTSALDSISLFLDASTFNTFATVNIYGA